MHPKNRLEILLLPERFQVLPRCSAGMKGFRPDAIIMDAPRSYHASKALVFLFVEGLLIATAVLAYSERLHSPSSALGDPALWWRSSCWSCR